MCAFNNYHYLQVCKIVHQVFQPAINSIVISLVMLFFLKNSNLFAFMLFYHWVLNYQLVHQLSQHASIFSTIVVSINKYKKPRILSFKHCIFIISFPSQKLQKFSSKNIENAVENKKEIFQSRIYAKSHVINAKEVISIIKLLQ